MKMKNTLLFAVLLLLITRGSVEAQQPTTAPSGAATQPAPRGLTVAIVAFSADDPGNPQLGAQIAETMTILLSGQTGFQLVDRLSLDRTLDEQELDLTGLVDTQQAIAVGKLVGAQIIVVGKAFRLGERTFITAKMIGTETTLVDGVLVKGDDETDLSELTLDLADQVASRLVEKGATLVAHELQLDPIPALKAAMAERNRVVVAVVIPEEHLAAARAAELDPAAETEVKRLLLAAGVELRDVHANELTTWVTRREFEGQEPWPRGLDDVDYVIAGEAFNDPATSIGNLRSAAARLEINMIERRSGKIVLAQDVTGRGVDLSENLAGRTALKKTGTAAAYRVLEYLVEYVPLRNALEKLDE
jgi:TolB-like protein